MPIYEYSCRKCGGHVEAMQKISDKPLVKHAGCGGRLEKQWSRTGFQFKGSGWYVTDYAGRKSEAKAEGEAGVGGKDEAAPEAKEAKADAKPEAQPAAKKTPKPKSPSKGASTD
jgi:putative FmdB family regulatory protein